MSARIVPLIAPAVLALLVQAAAWGADTAATPATPAAVTTATPANQAAIAPGATTPANALPTAVPAPDAAASAPLGAKDSVTAAVAPAVAPASLDNRVQELKGDVIRLNRDLLVLEEELLFPANTQVAVFVSMDIGEFFALDSLELKIDNKEVANYLYTPREAEALLKGGVHRVYLGNLKVGEHQLVAFFTGKGPNQLDYKRGANIKFEKGVGAKYLELKITDRQRKAQPEFAIKDWE